METDVLRVPPRRPSSDQDANAASGSRRPLVIDTIRSARDAARSSCVTSNTVPPARWNRST